MGVSHKISHSPCGVLKLCSEAGGNAHLAFLHLSRLRVMGWFGQASNQQRGWWGTWTGSFTWSRKPLAGEFIPQHSRYGCIRPRRCEKPLVIWINCTVVLKLKHLLSLTMPPVLRLALLCNNPSALGRIICGVSCCSE